MSLSQSTPRPGDLSRSARTSKTGAGGTSSYDLSRWALRATAGRKNVTARGVLLGIVSHADKHLRCHPNRETLASYHYGVAVERVTKSQTNHISEAVTQLTEMGLISVTKRKAKGGVSNEYTLLVPPREGEVVPGIAPLREGEQVPLLEASLPLREGEPPPLRQGGGNNQGTTIYNNQGTTRVDLGKIFKKKNVEDTTTHSPSGEAEPSAARRSLPTPVGTLEVTTIRKTPPLPFPGVCTRTVGEDRIRNLLAITTVLPEEIANLPSGTRALLIRKDEHLFGLLWEAVPQKYKDWLTDDLEKNWKARFG